MIQPDSNQHQSKKEMLHSKIVLITGSTDGIGKQTAIQFAKKGYHVIVHGRDQHKLDNTIETIKTLTKSTYLTPFLCDFKDIEMIKDKVEELLVKVKSIDILINNAGEWNSKRRLTQSGIEMTFAVNCVAPYIVTCVLLPSIIKNKGRIIFVGSISQASFTNLELIQHENYDTVQAYEDSKLYDVAMAFEFAHIYGNKISVHALHPGTFNTNLLAQSWGECGQEVEEVEDEFWIATDETVGCSTGKYYEEREEANAPKQAYSRKFRKDLFLILKDLTNILPPAT
ncbi:Short-chain dehydrogenase [Entamoeba marina]